MRKQYIPNSRLTEGTVYSFKLLKSISLDGDDLWFVMLDPFGYKILMPAKYYSVYGFKAGQLITCRVDKVNCNGRVFLEPTHPYYEEGKTYSFELVRTEVHTNLLDQQKTFFLVKDCLGLEWKVAVSDNHSESDHLGHVNCQVIRIKKGHLYLAAEGRQREHTQLRTGQLYAFTITDEVINSDDGFSYFILTDGVGHKHLLRKKYYHHYHLKLGSPVHCRVGHLTYEGTVHLEPEHPCYQPGLTYDFVVNDMTELIFSDGSVQKVLVLHDCFGEEVKVHVSDQEVPFYENKECIRARVIQVYKSRPEVDIQSADY